MNETAFLLGIFIFIGIGLLIFNSMMLFRNDRVYEHRKRIMDKIHTENIKALNEWATNVRLGEMGFESEPRYPLDFDILHEVDYDYVLNRFWRLDLDSFYPEEYRVGKN